MTSLLLAVIYLTFISLGLPDSLLGTAWPVMHIDLAAPVAAQSAISIVISCCTIVSSLLTARLVRSLGTGRLTAASVALTAAAIMGFSVASSFWQLCLIAIPYGLGAGAIDAALNNYVALHFGARHMSWLHCCWGIGASVGPAVMGWALTTPASWHLGYLAIGTAQVAIALVLAFSLPLWRRTDAKQPSGPDAAATAADPSRHDGPLTNAELLRLPGAAAAVSSFGFYCALESAFGLWCASYLVMARGFSGAVAAAMVAQFYLGITLGRLTSGFAAQWISSEQQIRLGQGLIAIGLIGLIVLSGQLPAGTAIFCIGFGCAPIYPSIVALTPRRFGASASQGLVSLQMACAYAGAMLVPPVFGFICGAGFPQLIPWLTAVLLVAQAVLSHRASTLTASRS